MTTTNRQIITVLLPDRVGALRDVTAVIVKLGGNIAGIRQTVVDGFFSLVFTSEHPAKVTSGEIRDELAVRLEPDAIISVQPCQILAPAPPVVGARYVAMTRGPDRAGTIHAISAFFVEHGINIEDWQAENEETDVIYTAQIAIPETADFRMVQEAFRTRMHARGLSAAICHENIFRATNEIGPIKELLGR
ncbi:MAG: ACT domain-containing protein [Magnetococcus sp. WYHC-3]